MTVYLLRDSKLFIKCLLWDISTTFTTAVLRSYIAPVQQERNRYIMLYSCLLKLINNQFIGLLANSKPRSPPAFQYYLSFTQSTSQLPQENLLWRSFR